MFLLRFILPEKDGLGHYSKTPAGPWYFVRAGEQWPRDPSKRMIDSTTHRIEDAKRFATEEEAREQLARCGLPPGWDTCPAPDA